VHLADQALRWPPVTKASALKASSAGEKPHTGCSSGRAVTDSAAIGGARRRSLSIAEEREARGRLDSPRTNGVPQRPASATTQAQERRAASRRIGRRPTSAGGKALKVSPPRCTHPCPADPREAKPKAAQSAAKLRPAAEMAGTDGSKPRRRTRTPNQSAAQMSMTLRVWFGSCAICGRYSDENQSGRLGSGERHVGLRRGRRGRNCPAGAKLRRAKSHERCRLAGQSGSARHPGQAAKDRTSRDWNARSNEPLPVANVSTAR